MKIYQITDIKPQQKNKGRVSFYVDGAYEFSLTLAQLEQLGLKVGDELTSENIAEYKELSEIGKLYDRALQQLARRPRSEWEMRDYLHRKNATHEEIEQIITKLKDYNYLNDYEFAASWVRSRRVLKSTSKRRLQQELTQKRVERSTIDEVLASDETEDTDTLQELIATKRKQTRYQDDKKLIAYLMRQGFSYSDIKDVLNEPSL